MERENQENRGESFSSTMHWDLWKVIYYRRKCLGGVTLFGKTAGIRRFESMVGKADCAYGEGNWKNNKEEEKET